MRYYDEDTQDVALGQVKINVPDTSNFKEVQLAVFLEKVWKLGKYFCSDHGWPGILHQRGDRHWLIAPEYVSPGIRNIKRIPPLPRPTSTAYSQILFNSCWMSSLPQNLARSKLSERWTLHFSTSLSCMRSGIKMILKRSTLQDFDHTIHVLSLFMFEMTHHLRWGSFQWCDIAYVALTRRSGGWLMIGGGWRYRGNWHLTRLAHSSSQPLACVHCILYIVLYTARTHQPGSSLCTLNTLHCTRSQCVYTYMYCRMFSQLCTIYVHIA